MVRNRFRIADIAQQMVGSILLSGPFVVTEAVWRLSRNMTEIHTVLVTGIILAIGYGALYKADRGRDVEDTETEPAAFGIPVRFISLLLVSYGAVTVLALLFRAPATFDAGLFTTFTAITVGAVFAVIGAATADSLF